MHCQNKSIGLLGGTFDPIHCGHLQMARYVMTHLALFCVYFIPAGIPAHRGVPIASAADRCSMLELALENQPHFYIDTRELDRPGPSYMIDTLIDIRSEHPQTPIVLILGQDAFDQLDTWKAWERLLDYAHCVVVGRTLPVMPRRSVALERYLVPHQTQDPKILTHQPAGRVLFLDWPMEAISATQIRTRLASGLSIHTLVPDAVEGWILQKKLYRGI